MSDEHRLNPHHGTVRPVLRVLGPSLVVAGAIFFIIGIVSFFRSFGSGLSGNPEFPRYFWCAFVGILLLGVGGTLCKFAFLGTVFRYVSAETAPVAKDTFNYLAEGTSGSVKTLAAAAAEGVSTGWHQGETAAACPRCQHPNDRDANHCEQCGAALSRTCPECQKPNDAEAKYCDNCGQMLAAS